MNLDNITQYFDFTNVTNIINVLTVIGLAYYNIKFKIDAVIAKAREQKAAEDVADKDIVINVMAETMMVQNQVLTEIAMASKLPTDAKLRIVNQLQRVTEATSKMKLEEIYNNAQEVVDDVKDIARTGVEAFQTFKDILGNTITNEESNE
jgi:hypothetical protein